MAVQVPASIVELNMARAHSVGARANEHTQLFGAALDYSYELGRGVPSLSEALGIEQFEDSEAGNDAGGGTDPSAGASPSVPAT